jgi:hypothetical protein
LFEKIFGRGEVSLSNRKMMLG